MNFATNKNNEKSHFRKYAKTVRKLRFITEAFSTYKKFIILNPNLIIVVRVVVLAGQFQEGIRQGTIVAWAQFSFGFLKKNLFYFLS